MSKPLKIPFTPEGYRQVELRYQTLIANRPLILERLQAAREMGDLSENGAYKAARWELGGLDRELREVTRLLRFGFIQPKTKGGAAGFGSTVSLTFNGEKVSYTLVNVYESNPSQKRLSVESPLGRQLVGKKEGDEFTLTTPAGFISCRIIEVT